MLARQIPQRANQKPTPTEHQIQCEILAALSLRYGNTSKFWRNNTGATKTQAGGFVRFGQVGSPDIMGIFGPLGRFVAIEVKTAKGKLSPAQETWLHESKLLGAIAGVCRSIEEALALIEGAK